MIEIKKGKSPNFLIKYGKEPLFEALTSEDKVTLRSHLLKDQGYLCAYCMCRIKGENDTKIEHYEPRNRRNQLAYRNLLIVCRGNEGEPERKTTCDTKKKNKTIYVDPQNAHHIKTLSYTREGVIKSSDAKINEDLNTALNLNEARLLSVRKAAIRTLENCLHGKSETEVIGTLKKAKKKYEALNKNGQYEPYVGTILHWINKKLRQKGCL